MLVFLHFFKHICKYKCRVEYILSFLSFFETAFTILVPVKLWNFLPDLQMEIMEFVFISNLPFLFCKMTCNHKH